MKQMEQLARDVAALEDMLAVCTRCGMCQANCPLYGETRLEADVSRGKLALVQGLIDGLFEDARGVKERLERCLLCGSCADGCPSGVNSVLIFIRTRSIITQYLGLPLAKRLLFKRWLANPGMFHRLVEKAARFQNFILKPEDNFQGTSCARMEIPLLKHRHLTKLAPTSFARQIQSLDQSGSGATLKVTFFTGCLIDKAFPHIGQATLGVLRHFKAGVTIPGDQGCCGIPALAAGDMTTFTELLAFHVRLFSAQSMDYLVTACATCAATIIDLWPALARETAPDNEEFIRLTDRIAEKTVDISWLMAKRFDLKEPLKNLAETGTTVTYHDPCHLRKSLGVHEEPRQVIRDSGYILREMEKPDACCGMGGSFNLSHYDLSSTIGEKKADDIIGTNADIAATSCPACMMQLTDMLARKDRNIRVMHPVELFARRLGETNLTW